MGTLCVNVLSEQQGVLCAQTAVRGGDKFAGVSWLPGANGAPALEGALASVEAHVEFEHSAGDHTIVVARVTGLQAHEGGGPLSFYGGGYGGFDGARHG